MLGEPMKESTVFMYWSRWITARRLTRTRVIDPGWVESHERIAAIGGFNLQLDDVQVPEQQGVTE